MPTRAITKRRSTKRKTPNFRAVVDALSLAVLVFRQHQLVYANASAQQLRMRLRTKYRSELTVLLTDHIR